MGRIFGEAFVNIKDDSKKTFVDEDLNGFNWASIDDDKEVKKVVLMAKVLKIQDYEINIQNSKWS